MSRREPVASPPRPKLDQVPVDYGHKHRQPSAALRALTVAVVGLIVVAALLGWYAFVVEARAIDAERQATETEERLQRLEEDLADRTRQRDAERDTATARDTQTRAEVMAVLCEVLAELPADAPNLNRIRDALGCAQPGAGPAAVPVLPGEPDTTTAPPPPPPPPPPSPSTVPPADGTPGAPETGGSPPVAPPVPTEPTRGLICGLLPLLC